MNEFGNVAGVKILFVHQNLGAQGGAEANILLTAGEFKRRGHRVALLHATTTGKGEENWRKIFSQCYQLDDAKAAQSTSNALAEFQPEIVYAHNLANLEALEALHTAGIPVVKMVHDHASYCMRGYKYNYFTRAVCQRPASLYCVFPCLASIARNHGPGASLKWVSYAAKKKEIALNRRCQQFVVYSDYSREELIRNGFERDKIHIHVPIQCWGTAGEVSSFSDRNLILFAGQIIRGKGVDFLLEALAQVKAPFECHILGDGNHRAHCDQLSTRLGLNDRVKFGGYVPHEQMKEFYLEASVFAVSSVWPEPFGMVGPEAMRYGLPVVAFDAGGIGEWLKDGENGFLVPTMDTTAFAARLDQLLRDKELGRRLGRRGMERVNNEYEAKRQIDGLEKLLLSVLPPARKQERNQPPENTEYELCTA